MACVSTAKIETVVVELTPDDVRSAIIFMAREEVRTARGEVSNANSAFDGREIDDRFTPQVRENDRGGVTVYFRATGVGGQ